MRIQPRLTPSSETATRWRPASARGAAIPPANRRERREAMKSFNGFVMRLGLILILTPLMPTSASAQDDGQEAVAQAAVPQTVRVFSGNTHFFKRVLTEADAVVLTPGAIGTDGFSAYVNLPGAGPANG